MYILIGGGGQVGYYLTKELLNQNHEVLLLDKDARRVSQLREELGAAVARGDACEARTLEEVGCERADMVIAVTGDDEDNLVICQVAKARFGVKQTIARVNNPRNARLFKRLGIDMTVSPTSAILKMIEAQIPHHGLIQIAQLDSAGLGIVEVPVSPDSPAINQAIRSLNLPITANIAWIKRGSENIFPSGDTVIRSEDRIFALTTTEGEDALRRAIVGDSEDYGAEADNL